MARVFASLFFAFMLASCRQTNSDTSNLRFELLSEPPLLMMGDAVLIVRVRDQNGLPVNDATLELRGDMSHAGMTPVFGTLTSVENGDYRFNFEWSMVGEWVITVSGTTADEKRIFQRFERMVNR